MHKFFVALAGASSARAPQNDSPKEMTALTAQLKLCPCESYAGEGARATMFVVVPARGSTAESR